MKSDKETRFERYLAYVAERLKERQLPGRLLYDDKHGGDVLALPVVTTAGLIELTVERQRADRALLVLTAESREATRLLSDALQGKYKSISRLRSSAMRAFVRRVEQMAAELYQTYDVRAGELPHTELEALAGLIPEAKLMVGVEGLIHQRKHDEAAEVPQALAKQRGKEKRAARRYPSRFAARINTSRGPRAMLARGTPRAFEPRGEALATVYNTYLRALPQQKQLAVAQKHRLMIRLSVGPQRVQGRSRDAGEVVEDVVDALDAASSAIESVGNAASGCADVGSGCDAVDCGGIDCG